MNNKGYTLIELLVTMVISAVVMTIVISFLATNSRSYTYAGEEVNLQVESQTVMNQLYDAIVEASWVELVPVNSDQKMLLLYHYGIIDVIFFDKDKEHLYFIKNQSESDISNPAYLSYTEAENLMADHIFDIAVTPTDPVKLMKDKQINVTATFRSSSLEYTVERNIKMRNEPVVP